MVQDIISAVSTLGFPITMCGALFWYMVKQNEMHQTESKEMKEAITELKVAIVQLTDRLKQKEDNENA